MALSLVASRMPAKPPAWIGSNACAPCHREIFESWSKTGMARTSGAVEALPKADFHQTFSGPGSAYRYTVSSGPDGYALTVRKGNPAGDVVAARLSYFVGSGAAARSYLIDVDGFLYEAPVAYYSRAAKWSFAPGYEKYSYPYLARAVPPGCLECHATGVRVVAGTQNGYQRPAFLEGGAGCERCHGPGGVHARTGRGEDIVNPARLNPERRDSVCEQCHLSGEVRVPRGSAADEFQAGSNFADYAIPFSRQTPGGRMTVTSHVENLAASECKKASGERMWCGSCHDPHFEPPGEEKAAWFRSKCLSCHAVSACTERQAARVAQQDNCVACHMPRRRVTDAAHVVYTDHSIPRRAATAEDSAAQTPAPDAPLVAFHEAAPGARDLGLAYAILGAREQNAVYRDRAYGLLRTALRDDPEDPQVLSYLAELDRPRSQDGEAIRLYKEVMRLDPSQSGAPAVLGAYAMERGDYNQAIRLWRQALRISPALLLVRANLAAALIRTGQREEARAVLEKALQFDPEFPAARSLLRQLR